MTAYTFQVRRGTTAEWAASSRVLRRGEPGLDTDLGIQKIGDGVHLWSALTGLTRQSVLPVSAMDHGNYPTLSTLQFALDAAEARGLHTPVYLGGQLWDIGTHLSMSGRSSVLVGDGAGGTEAAPRGAVIRALSQDGPVIDWTDWVRPTPGFAGKVKHHGFLVLGSGVADPALSGMKFTKLSSTTFSDITIRNTGGPCIDMASSPGNAVYICDFERIVLMEPVNMNANDVPFFRSVEANGNRFRSFILRAFSHVVAPSGAVQILGNATYSAHDNLYDAWCFEGLNIPTNGTLFHHEANGNIVRDFEFFDCPKESSESTGTSYLRFASPTVNYGGNLLGGVVPGKGTNSTDPDCGVDMRQSNNAVVGVKGYKGTNVIIASGVQHTHVNLSGSVSAASDPAVVDSSGNLTNTYVDDYNSTEQRPARIVKHSTASYKEDQVTGGAFAGMPRFSNPSTPAEGGVMFGTGGSRWQASGTTMMGTADQISFRDIALGNLLSVTKNGSVKGIKFYTSASLPTASATYRGQVGWLEGGAGVADRLVICRKDAADAYAWTDLY